MGAQINDKVLFTVVMMLLTSFLVPNNLSIDAIGGEQYHRTLETLMTTSISIRAVFVGKTLFIILLGAVSLSLTAIMDNIILKAFFGLTFLDGSLTIWKLVFLFGIGILSIALISFIGSVISLVSSNLKVNGYLVTLISGILILVIYKVMYSQSYTLVIFAFVFMIFICLAIYGLVSHYLTKQRIMKYTK